MKSMICAVAACALVVPQTYAQEVTVSATAVVPVIAPASADAKPVLRAGSPILLKMAEEVTTKNKAARVGQQIKLEVAEALEINGVVVIPVGTPAWGELTRVRNKGMWGKSGALEARVNYLRVNGRQVRLSGSFDDKGTTGTAGVVGAVLLLPIAGFLLTGTSALLPLGGPVKAFIDEDIELSFAAAPAPEPMVVAAPEAAPPTKE